MTTRFDDLKKIPPEPAARMLARTGLKLTTPLKAPASAPVGAVLAELEAAGAAFDMLLMLAVALPAREAVWWGCLAARDRTGPVRGRDVPPPLAAAETWVFKPSDETRAAAKTAMEGAEPDDDTVYCAMAALYADGTLGPGDAAEFPAPPAGVASAVHTLNMLSVQANKARFAEHARLLIDRGLDIARGGNGNVAPPAEAAAAAAPSPASAPKGAP
ncbi:MAG: hypothetical protein H5U20_04345 [Rhodobacteraceae bacterium]|nr:hypothetical protein [Paracoccaceae bacterium]